MSDVLCAAELEHTHGTARCRLPAGHPGEHSGTCWICFENGEADDLHWVETNESWVKP